MYIILVFKDGFLHNLLLRICLGQPALARRAPFQDHHRTAALSDSCFCMHHIGFGTNPSFEVSLQKMVLADGVHGQRSPTNGQINTGHISIKSQCRRDCGEVAVSFLKRSRFVAPISTAGMNWNGKGGLASTPCDSPPLNWSGPIVRNRRIKDGNQTTQA